jgi:hypothetical protein
LREAIMEDKKIYLLAELTIRPGFLEEVKAILKEGPDTPRVGLRSLVRDRTKG